MSPSTGRGAVMEPIMFHPGRRFTESVTIGSPVRLVNCGAENFNQKLLPVESVSRTV